MKVETFCKRHNQVQNILSNRQLLSLKNNSSKKSQFENKQILKEYSHQLKIMKQNVSRQKKCFSSNIVLNCIINFIKNIQCSSRNHTAHCLKCYQLQKKSNENGALLIFAVTNIYKSQNINTEVQSTVTPLFLAVKQYIRWNFHRFVRNKVYQ